MPRTERYKENNREYQRQWRQDNKELHREKNREYYKRLKRLTINTYGGECKCCGEDNIDFLSVHHIDGGGRKHRKIVGDKFYPWLKRNNFPDGYQILCFNCNWGSRLHNGICPHEVEKCS